MKFHRLFLLLILPLYLLSCGTVKRLPYYLEHVTDSTVSKDVKIQELRIQKNDLLSIQISSLSTNLQADQIYNQPIIAGATEGSGFLVDLNGNIEHHRLGTIHAEGLTKSQLAAEIKQRLTEPVELLKSPTVVIRFKELKITMLGQVGQQGVIKIPGESITILQAVGLAGGIPDYGKRTNLKVLREIDGKREIGIVDLSSKDLFDSPYYYLMQNDVIVVEQTNRKLNDEDQARVIQKVSYAFSLVTIVATLANIFIKN
ncbi:MAG: polysaccharide biosynthesis/export family protein [Chitinophagaceae bacterium]